MVDLPAIKIDVDSSYEREPRILKAPFGDGYSQPVADGLNAYAERWSLSFKSRPKADIATLRAFLDVVGNTGVFNWTPPDEAVAKRWIVAGSWVINDREADTGSIRFTIERWFGP